nr:hypothetical protein [uncultured Chryseobacterium sp.]
MKTTRSVLISFSCLFLSSCWPWNGNDEPLSEPQSAFIPVLVTRAELNNITLQTIKSTMNNEKIYVKDQYIFVNDRRDGFHIINNSDPANPQKLKYLKALGSTDIAIRNDILYINQARDLVALKINPATNEVQILKRIENVFPALKSPDGFDAAGTDKIVIDWKQK